MIVECGYCGAPLDVEERKKVFACRYCGRKNERARAKTIAETTPRDFAPPPVWTPPPGREVDSSKPLKYRSGVPAWFLALLALGIVVAVVFGILHDAGMFGAKPDTLAHATLTGTPEQFAKRFGGDANQGKVRVTLHSDDFERITYHWSGDHPFSFWLDVRPKQPPDLAARSRIASKLRGGFNEEERWSWGDLGIRFDAASGAVYVDVKPTDDNPRWRRQIDAAHELVLGAIANDGVAPSDAEMIELLAAGYAFADLSKIAGVTFENGHDAVAKQFPGALFEPSKSRVTANIPVAHPSFLSVKLEWSIHGFTFDTARFDFLGARSTYPSKAAAISTCLGKVYPPFPRAKDTLDLGGGVTLDVSTNNGGVMVNSYGGTISKEAWEKVVASLDACR